MAEETKQSRTASCTKKVLIIGDHKVGKTSILLRYTSDQFGYNTIATLGVDIRQKIECFEDKQIHLQIWDTAGQEKFHTITSSFFKDADGIVIAYDITSRFSFDNVQRWLNQIKDKAKPNVPLVLVGNKSDVEESLRKISLQEGSELGDHLQIPFFETSAKEGTGICEMFRHLAQTLISQVNFEQEEQYNRQKSSLRATVHSKPKKKCC